MEEQRWVGCRVVEPLCRVAARGKHCPSPAGLSPLIRVMGSWRRSRGEGSRALSLIMSPRQELNKLRIHSGTRGHLEGHRRRANQALLTRQAQGCGLPGTWACGSKKRGPQGPAPRGLCFLPVQCVCGGAHLVVILSLAQGQSPERPSCAQVGQPRDRAAGRAWTVAHTWLPACSDPEPLLAMATCGPGAGRGDPCSSKKQAWCPLCVSSLA